jgi:predicted Fe-Mo cluster-binding NifX family protein
MKVFIAIDSNNDLDSPLGNRFGRAQYFLIYDTIEDRIESIQENTFKDEAQGVGIKVASLVMEKGCGAVIGPQPGPKMVEILAKAGIKLLITDEGTARQAIDRFRSDLKG